MNAEEVYVQLQNKGLRLSCVKGKIRSGLKTKFQKENMNLKFQRWSDPINSICHPSKEMNIMNFMNMVKSFFMVKKEKQINLFLLIKIKK